MKTLLSEQTKMSSFIKEARLFTRCHKLYVIIKSETEFKFGYTVTTLRQLYNTYRRPYGKQLIVKHIFFCNESREDEIILKVIFRQFPNIIPNGEILPIAILPHLLHILSNRFLSVGYGPFNREYILATSKKITIKVKTRCYDDEDRKNRKILLPRDNLTEKEKSMLNKLYKNDQKARHQLLTLSAFLRNKKSEEVSHDKEINNTLYLLNRISSRLAQRDWIKTSLSTAEVSLGELMELMMFGFTVEGIDPVLIPPKLISYLI
jgi:hypothetical protein